MSYFGVIADDLTGAMDAGMQMLNKNMIVRIALSVKDFTSIIRGSDFVVVNTQSRNCSLKDAYSKTEEAVKQFLESGCSIIYKKIDSTLRGHIGAEIRAVLDSSAFDCIIVAPALPFNKRTTKDGIHFVDGVKLADTELAKDPFSPVCYSAIDDIIKQEFNVQVGLVNLEKVRKGSLSVCEEISDLIQKDIRVIVADAVEEGDLKNIAVGAKLFKGRKVLCGSAGLFQYFDESYEIKPYHNKEGEPYSSINQAEPILVISGSPAAMSKKQIEYLARQRQDVKIINFNITSVPHNNISDTAKNIIDQVIYNLGKGYNTVVDAAGEGKEAILKGSLGNKEKLDEDRHLILQFVSDIAYHAVTQVPISGLVLFGGDTAVAIASRLDVKGIEIKGPVEPYIPKGVFIGGYAPNLPVVTKAGGFGKQNSLDVILKSFKGDENL